MMNFGVKVRSNIKYLYPGGRGERELNKDFKMGLKRVLIMWHDNFAQRHFYRQAYSLYPNEYPGAGHKIKRKGLPLVMKGDFRRRMLQRKSVNDIRGTSKKARMVLKFGRPSGMSKEEMRAATFIEMRKRNITFKQAERQVYSNAGYGKDNVKLFKSRLEAMNDQEVDRMAKYLEDYIIMRAESNGAMVEISK